MPVRLYRRPDSPVLDWIATHPDDPRRASSHASQTAPPPSGSPTPHTVDDHHPRAGRHLGRGCRGPRPRRADGQWCDPAGRRIGQTPTPRTGQTRTDACQWVKLPGESDGRKGTPGAFSLSYVYDLAR
ncbi:hypothetical protein SY2F82_48040 [Streptomyces sp. Y2F8-2]|nr:hypothetical protein SY2F82_48040 [Streptomyces sp. Y2F8-2]